MLIRISCLGSGIFLIIVAFEIQTTSFWDSGRLSYKLNYTGFSSIAAIILFIIGIYFIYLSAKSFYKYYKKNEKK